MKKSLAHLPKEKQSELMLITEKIRDIVPEAEMIFLFGSYARGDWVDGPHVQGRGKLTIRKKSDYDICVVTRFAYTARDTALWDKLKAEFAKMDLSTIVRIIPREVDFVNYKLSNGQYFFTEICQQGIILYDSDEVQLSARKELDPVETKKIAQATFDETFTTAKDFYYYHEQPFKDGKYKIAAFNLHQAAECCYGTVLLVYTNYKPKTHDLDTLRRLAANHDPAFFTVFPLRTKQERDRFDLLRQAYVGARYHDDYKITPQELKYLARCVELLKEQTETSCENKMESFV